MIKELFGDMVLIKPIEENKVSKGGIIIPDSVDNVNLTSKGLIEMVGPGTHDQQTGKFIPTTVKVGDTILYDSKCYIMEDELWEGLYLISEKDIITTIQ